MSKELTLQQRIIAVQSELKAPKNQFNKFGKYKYRSCEDILEGLKPLLKKYDLMQTIEDDIQVVGDRFYIVAIVSVSHGENTITTKALAREPANKKGMDDSQITGTASSYARKYALNGMWQIDDSKDADTDEHTQQTKVDNDEQIKAVNKKPELTPAHKKWQGAVKALANNETTIEKIAKHFLLSDKIANELEKQAKMEASNE